MATLRSLLLCLGVSTLIGSGAADCSAPTSAPANVTELKVALVRAPPPNWPLPLGTHNWTGIEFNISQTVDEGIDLIQQAKNKGAGLVTFPELWFPGFPKGRELYHWNVTHLPSYIDNCMVVGDENWNRLVAAITEIGIWTALGFVERRGDHIFMAQALISPSGELVRHRHKLRPSGSERDIFSDGTINDLTVINTDIGRVGMLECAEHWYPSMTFAVAAQRPKLHIGNFPYVLDDGDETEAIYFRSHITKMATASYAFLSGSYVLIPAVGYSFVMDPMTNVVAEMSANASFEEHPILYHTLNATLLYSEDTYDSDVQVSWGVLQQMNEAFPTYIPQETGDLVPHREQSIAKLKAGNFTWSETGYISPLDTAS